MSKNVLTDMNVDYESDRINFSYDFMSTRFDLSMQFDEFPKPIEEMTFQELNDSAWQKLNKKLKSYLD